MSFNSRVPANHCKFQQIKDETTTKKKQISSSLGWFGLRQDVCSWLLHLCPIFETYANIEYHFPADNSPHLSTHRTPRRYFFRQKSSSLFCEQIKLDQCENELLTTVIHLPLNILKLHEPD